MVVTLHQFFSETSIHGLRYWGHKSPTRKARAFWVVVTLTGCFMTLILLFRLINDWSSYPTYTTIDSSAIPIDTVPFPSVTVCQGDGSGHPAPSGGFGFIRKVLDSYKLYNKDENYSPVLTKFGKKFEAYLNFTGNLFLDKLLTYLKRSDEDIQKEVDKVNQLGDYFGYDKYSALGKELLCDNYSVYSTTLLSDRVITEYPSLFHNIVKSFQESQLRGLYNTSCKDQMEKVLIASYYLLSNTRNIRQIGTLLAIVAPLIWPSHSFKSTEFEEIPECEAFHHLELNLHDTFVEMASGMGIPKSGSNRNISLFELPAILESDGKPFSSPKSWMTQHPHYTCQMSHWFTLGFWYENLPCMSAWEEYILGGESIAKKYNKRVRNIPFYDDNEPPPVYPCNITEHESCPMKNAGDVNLTSVMSVMKFANRRGQSYFDVEQINNLLPEYSKYEKAANLMPSFDLDEKFVPDIETYIPYCSINRFDNSKITSAFARSYGPSTCMAFTPIVTNTGICYGFNAMHPKDVFNTSSKFYNSFVNAYAPELKHHKDLEMAYNGQNGQGLIFYLDKNKILSTDQFEGGLITDNGHFSIAINTVLNAFNVKSSVTQARMGHKLEILVNVNKLTVSDGVRSLPLAARKCRLTSEIPKSMTMFSYYTQDLCQFECSLKHIRKICGCTPWHFPFQPVEDIEICDHYGKYCFEYFIQDQDNVNQECDCLPDCERLKYSFTEKEWPLDVKHMCSPGKNRYAYTNFKKGSWAHKTLYSSLLSLLHNGTIDMSRQFSGKDIFETCAKTVREDLAVIKVRMASSVYERSQIRLKQTFADKVSGFGGTLGLFVGASFITLVEVCYWTVRMLLGCRGCQKGKNSCKCLTQIC